MCPTSVSLFVLLSAQHASLLGHHLTTFFPSPSNLLSRNATGNPSPLACFCLMAVDTTSQMQNYVDFYRNDHLDTLPFPPPISLQEDVLLAFSFQSQKHSPTPGTQARTSLL